MNCKNLHKMYKYLESTMLLINSHKDTATTVMTAAAVFTNRDKFGYPAPEHIARLTETQMYCIINSIIENMTDAQFVAYHVWYSDSDKSISIRDFYSQFGKYLSESTEDADTVSYSNLEFAPEIREKFNNFIYWYNDSFAYKVRDGKAFSILVDYDQYAFSASCIRLVKTFWMIPLVTLIDELGEDKVKEMSYKNFKAELVVGGMNTFGSVFSKTITQTITILAEEMSNKVKQCDDIMAEMLCKSIIAINTSVFDYPEEVQEQLVKKESVTIKDLDYFFNIYLLYPNETTHSLLTLALLTYQNGKAAEEGSPAVSAIKISDDDMASELLKVFAARAQKSTTLADVLKAVSKKTE